MKITKSQLKQLIKEEIEEALSAESQDPHVKLLDLWIDSEKNHPKDALLKVDKNYVENIKSKEIFEHVLECQYLINNPGS